MEDHLVQPPAGHRGLIRKIIRVSAKGNAIDLSSPTVADGMIYIGSQDGKLYAFDAHCRQNCQPLWSYATGGGIWSSPTVANGVVYITSWDGSLYAFDARCRSDCQPLWSYATSDGGTLYAPAVAYGFVYVASTDEKVYVFDASCRSDCQLLWSYTRHGMFVHQ